MLRLLLALLPVVALALPAAAHAATASSVDGRIHVVAAPGEQNHLRITREDIAWPVGVWDLQQPVTTASGCWQDRSVQCWGGSPIVSLGDGDDTLTYFDDTTDYPIGPAEVDAGPGEDLVTTAMSADRIDGGAGDDELAGFVGDDTLIGGPGNDRLDGQFHDDAIDARDGAGGDTVLCGDGDDTVDADAGDEVAADCETVRLVVTDDPQDPRDPETPRDPSSPADPTTPGAPSPPGAPAPPSTASPRVAFDPVPVPTTTPSAATRDRRAPKLTVARRGRTLTLRCDEACTVRVIAGGKRYTRRVKAGRAVRVRVGGRARIAKLTATDAAGNRTAARRTLARAAKARAGRRG